MGMERWPTVKEFCERTGLGKNTVYEAISGPAEDDCVIDGFDSSRSFGTSDLRHLARPITRLVLAFGGMANASKIVQEMTSDECHEMAGLIDAMDASSAVPLPGASCPPFAKSDSFWHVTVKPLLKRRTERPRAKSLYVRDDIFRTVKKAVRLEEFAGRFTDLERRSNRARGLCPIHQECTPSFVVYIQDQRWHCFGECAAGGDVVELCRRLKEAGKW